MKAPLLVLTRLLHPRNAIDQASVHVLAGVLALLLGPGQFWLGLNHRTSTVHRTMGVMYVLSVGVGGAAAFYLAAHNDFSWVFGLGLATMSAVWIVATALATIAICLHQVEQHREWMIRSYTVTFGFVTFRVLYEVLDALELGTMVERLTAASWLAWSTQHAESRTGLQVLPLCPGS